MITGKPSKIKKVFLELFTHNELNYLIQFFHGGQNYRTKMSADINGNFPK